MNLPSRLKNRRRHRLTISLSSAPFASHRTTSKKCLSTARMSSASPALITQAWPSAQSAAPPSDKNAKSASTRWSSLQRWPWKPTSAPTTWTPTMSSTATESAMRTKMRPLLASSKTWSTTSRLLRHPDHHVRLLRNQQDNLLNAIIINALLHDVQATRRELKSLNFYLFQQWDGPFRTQLQERLPDVPTRMMNPTQSRLNNQESCSTSSAWNKLQFHKNLQLNHEELQEVVDPEQPEPQGLPEEVLLQPEAQQPQLQKRHRQDRDEPPGPTTRAPRHWVHHPTNAFASLATRKMILKPNFTNFRPLKSWNLSS